MLLYTTKIIYEAENIYIGTSVLILFSIFIFQAEDRLIKFKILKLSANKICYYLSLNICYKQKVFFFNNT